MVPIDKDNAYQLRDHLYSKAVNGAHTAPFKSCLLHFLGLDMGSPPAIDLATLTLYERCAIAGLDGLSEPVSNQDVSRLLGQAAKIDSTPRQWVADMFGVMAVKWLTIKIDQDRITGEFDNWISGFLGQQMDNNRLNCYEKDIAMYIRSNESATYASACVPLFLHYRKIRRIDDHQTRLSLIDRFMVEFRAQAQADASTALLSLMVYVFDRANQEVAVVPPKGWGLSDLVNFLEHIVVVKLFRTPQ